jgi:uncharacterized protein
MNFKAFESLGKIPADPVYIREPQGKLRRTASVKVWDKIGVGYSKIDERGVFCVDYIKSGECFEEAPVVILPAGEVKETALMDYTFKLNATEYALALGYGSLYNHRNQPMAEWKIDETRKTISFFALRDIEPGEEIFISYGKSYWKSRDISAKISPDSKNK